MDDKTIFQVDKTQQPVPTAPPVAVEAPKPQPTPAAPTAKPPWGQTPPPEEPTSFFSFSKLLKAIIGLVFIGVVIAGIVYFVLPHFTKTKVEKVTLTYWGLWESTNIMQGIINDFQKQNPNITITYAKQDIKQYKTRIATRVPNGNGPDVFLFHNTWLLQMMPFLLPLPSDVIQKNDFEKTYYPVVKDDLTKNGAIYGVPSGMDTLALFVNTEMFTQSGATIPTTWQDFGKVARSLTVIDEGGKIKTAGAALGTFDNITHAPDIISLLFVQNGADLKNLTNTSQNAIDTLDFYTDFAKNEGKVWDDTLDPSILAFAKGNLAMYFGFSWDIFTIKALSPNLSFQIVPVPHLPGRNMTVASYWNNGVSVKSTHQKEALLFLKFLAAKETQQKLFSEESKTRLFGQLYARTDLADSLKTNTLVYPFVNQASDASSSFFASDTYDEGLNSQMNAYLGNAVRSILANTSTGTAVDTLTQGITQVLNQYSK